MIGFKKTATVVLLVGLGFAGTTQAMLVDRGNGLLYDNVLDVTWLQDANYAHTSGYAGANSSGQMDWSTAMTWAADLVYGGYSDWRLASNSPVNGSNFNYNLSYNGSTDYGPNITSPHSELAYMYHVNLGLKDYYNTAGNVQSDFGIFGNGTTNGVDMTSDGQTNVGLVNNLQSFVYWSNNVYAPNLDYAWGFDTHYGVQDYNYKKIQYNVQLYAWAVHPGDVSNTSTVPEPSIIWLFASGLGLLSLTSRKKSDNYAFKETLATDKTKQYTR